MKISRRKFLKVAGVAAAASPFIQMPHLALGATAPDLPLMVGAPPRPFGRAVQMVAVRAEPSIYAKITGYIGWNKTVALLGQAESDKSPTKYNQIWYRVDGGWAYSAFLQPCENQTNEPITSISEPFWAEVTVPSGVARATASDKSWTVYPVYFGSVFQVEEATQDPDSKTWYYRINDGYGPRQYLRAEALRRIDPSELAPISPEVPPDAKSITVDLKTKMVTAYENDKAVFSAKGATGAEFTKPDGTKDDFRTMRGEFRIYDKRLSSRMIGGGEKGDPGYYDLPGVAWCSYFTASRIAFHTAYWHNDWGAERSHGCVNMLPEHALWIYRWTTPAPNYAQRIMDYIKPAQGTTVKVI